MTERFQVGVIAGTHGVRGDVKVFPVTDDPSRFKKYKNVYLYEGHMQKPVRISGVRFSGKFVILHLDGIEDMDAARLLRGAQLWIDRKDAAPLPEGMYYIPDLIGLSVLTDDGKRLGSLTDVLRTGANDVYCVTTDDGREVLIPAIRDCILETKPEEGCILVHLLPGLMDLQQ